MESRITGLTGGIGAGKSIVSRILRCNGFKVYDCDSEAKILMNSDSNLKQRLQDRLGEEIYYENGTLDRKKMSELLFNDNSIREFVNSLVHEAVRNQISALQKKSKNDFFVESAILVTSFIDEMCDRIWLVEAPLEERIKRVEQRDGTPESQILLRIESQMQEYSRLPERKTTVLINEDNMPLLPVVLRLTDKDKNHQTYYISC